MVVAANLTLEPQTISIAMPPLRDARIAIIGESSIPALARDAHWLDHASESWHGAQRNAAAELPRMGVAVITGALS